uniref:Uncharacterized protein n=1 Tax=Arundo donax TaxID=35708 RepID=A0A0A8YZ00_ARUDO
MLLIGICYYPIFVIISITGMVYAIFFFGCLSSFYHRANRLRDLCFSFVP